MFKAWIQVASVVGEVLADLATRGSSRLDLLLLDISRFEEASAALE